MGGCQKVFPDPRRAGPLLLKLKGNSPDFEEEDMEEMDVAADVPEE